MINKIASCLLALLFLCLDCNATIAHYILPKASLQIVDSRELQTSSVNNKAFEKAILNDKQVRGKFELENKFSKGTKGSPELSYDKAQVLLRGFSRLDPINAPYNDFLKLKISKSSISDPLVHVSFQSSDKIVADDLVLTINLHDQYSLRALKTGDLYSFTIPSEVLADGENLIMINNSESNPFSARDFEVSKAAIGQGQIENVSALYGHDLVLDGQKSAGKLLRKEFTPSVPNGYTNLMQGESMIYLDQIDSIGIDCNFILEGVQANSADDISIFKFDEQSANWIALTPDTAFKIKDGYSASRKLMEGGLYFAGSKSSPASSEGNLNLSTSLPEISSLNPFEGYGTVSKPTINQMGTATTNFPIKLPPGRNGFQPDLNINYSSESKSGCLGIGWDINSSSIEVDTRWGVPTFDVNIESEIYTLDGESLNMEGGFKANRRNDDNTIATRTMGSVEFFPEIRASWRSIKRFGSSTSGYYWVVTNSDQSKFYYGTEDGVSLDPNSILQDDDGNIISWKLSRIQDKWGNYIDYEYQAFVANTPSNDILNGATQLLIKSIKYTGFEGSANLDPPYRIELTYDPTVREDARISFRTGKKIGTFKTLESIKVLFDPDINVSGDEQEIREYLMTYQSGDFEKTLLSTIAEYVNGQEFYKYSFDYYQNNYSFEAESTTIGSHSESDVEPEDVGIPYEDELNSGFEYSPLGSSYSAGYSLGGIVGVGLYKPKTSAMSNSIYGGFSFGKDYTYGRVQYSDINGDGLPDLILQSKSSTSPTLRYYPGIVSSDGTPSFGPMKSVLKLTTDSEVDRFSYSVSETDNYSTGAIVGVGVNTNTSIGGSFQYSWNSTEAKTYTYLSDVNGDGISDIVNNGSVSFGYLDPVSHDVKYVNTSESTPNPIYETGNITIPPNDPGSHQESEVVRSWRALKDGQVDIVNDITLNSQSEDGIEMSIELQSASGEVRLLSVNSINPGSSVSFPLNDIDVNQGDILLFRTTAKINSKYDLLNWNPEIHYNSGALLNPDQIDYGNISADQGFILSNYNPINISKINSAYLTFPACNFTAMSDSVTFTINFFGIQSGSDFSDEFSYTVPPGAISSVTNSNFNLGQYNSIFGTGLDCTTFEDLQIVFSVTSPSNINWKNIDWRPIISDNPGGLNSQQDFTAYPVVDYGLYERIHLMNGSIDLSSFGLTAPAIKLQPKSNAGLAADYYSQVSHTDPVRFKIKVKTVQNLVRTYEAELSANPYTVTFYDHNVTTGSNTALGQCLPEYSIELSEFENEELFISAITEDVVLAPLIDQYLEVDAYEFLSTYDPVDDIWVYDCIPFSLQNLYSVYYTQEDKSLGAEYLGWGQFGWKGEISSLISPSEMEAGRDVNGNYITQADIDNIDAGNLQQYVSTYGQNPDLKENPFKVLAPKRGETEVDNYFLPFGVLETKAHDAWIHPFNPFARILSQNISLGRLGEIPTESEVTVATSASSSFDKTAPVLKLEAYNNAVSFGGSLATTPVSAGATYSRLVDEGDNDKGNIVTLGFQDINGDGYPDQLIFDEDANKLETFQTDATGNTKSPVDYPGIKILRRKFASQGISASLAVDGDIFNAGENTKSRKFSSGLGGNYNYTDDHLLMEEGLLDMNGDGLLDYVDQTNLNAETNGNRTEISFNTGRYLDVNDKTIVSIKNLQDVEGTAHGAGLSAGTANNFEGETGGEAEGETATSAGLSLSFINQNQETQSTFIDVNSDGLVDWVRYKEVNGVGGHYVTFNLGTKFSSIDHNLVTAEDNFEASELRSYQASLNLIGAMVIFSPPPIKIVAGAHGDGYLARNNQELALRDVNGDGLLDKISLDEKPVAQDEMQAQLCLVEKSNLLKRVNSPTGSSITLDYQRMGNRYGFFDRELYDYQTFPKESEEQTYWDMPFSKWVLSEVTVYDGMDQYEESGSVISDGTDSFSNKFMYDGGVYDRRERKFTGFTRIGVLSPTYTPNTDYSTLKVYGTEGHSTIQPNVSDDENQRFLTIVEYAEPASNILADRKVHRFKAKQPLDVLELVLIKEDITGDGTSPKGEIDPNDPYKVTRAHLIRKKEFTYEYHRWNQEYINDEYPKNTIYLDDPEFSLPDSKETDCIYPELQSQEVFSYHDFTSIGENAKFHSQKILFTYNKYGLLKTAVINGMTTPGVESWSLSSASEGVNVYDREFTTSYTVDLIAKFNYYRPPNAGNRVGQLLRSRLFKNDTNSPNSLLRQNQVSELITSKLAAKKVGVDNNNATYSYTEYDYNNHGLISKVTYPTNHLGDSKELHVNYETNLNSHPQQFTTRFILHDGSQWDEITKVLVDPKTGLTSMAIDPNGQPTEVYYDQFYRPYRVYGPRELKDQNAPYTVEFNYWSGDLASEAPWAMAKQYLGTPSPKTEFGATNQSSYPALVQTAGTKVTAPSPTWSSDKIVRTAVQTDGLGRLIQRQQEVSIYNSTSKVNEKGRRITGPATVDNLGRLFSVLPSKALSSNTTEADLYSLEVSEFISVPPALVTYPDYFGRNSLTYSLNDYDEGTTDRFYTKSETSFLWTDLIANPTGTVGFRAQETSVNGHKDMSETIIIDKNGNSKQLVRGDASNENITIYNHDVIGQLLSTTNPADNTTTYTYDRRGRLEEELHADRGKTSITYDLAGNTTQVNYQEIDQSGSLGASLDIDYEYEYDRMIKKLYPSSSDINDLKLTYGRPGNVRNAIGRVVSVKQGKIGQRLLVEQFRYNENGNIIRKKRRIAVPQLGEQSLTTDYVYDSWGRVSHMRYPDGEVLTYHYADGGGLEKLETSHHFITNSASYYLEAMAYDGFGQPLLKEYGNKVQSGFNYDVTTRTLKDYSLVSSVNNELYTQIQILDKDFTYDATGNISKVENTAPSLGLSYNQLGGKYDFEYTYDALNQLETATGGWEDANGPRWTFNLSLSYDNNGRITEKEQSVLDQANGNAPHPDFHYNLGFSYSNNLKNGATDVVDNYKNPVENTTFQYNNYGSLSAIVKNGVEEIEHLYNEEQRLRGSMTETKIQHNVYDPYGIRIMRAKLSLEKVFIDGIQVGSEYQLSPYLIHAGPHYLFQPFDNVVKISKHYYGANGKRISSKVLSEPRVPDGYEDPEPGMEPTPVYGNYFNDFDPNDPYALTAYEPPVQNNVVIDEGLSKLFTDFGKSNSFTQIDFSQLPTHLSDEYSRDACSWGVVGGELPPSPPSNSLASQFQEEFCKCTEYDPEYTSEIDCDLFPEIYWYHGDGLGNVEYLTDLAGMPYEYFWYSPSGEPLVHQHQANAGYSTPYQFTAKTYDALTNLVYMGARYYSPKFSSFTSVDPLRNFRTWISPYNYVQNNPIMRQDPTGMLDTGPDDGSENYIVVKRDKNGSQYVEIGGIKYTYNEAANTWVNEDGEGLSINPEKLVNQGIQLREVTITAASPQGLGKSYHFTQVLKSNPGLRTEGISSGLSWGVSADLGLFDPADYEDLADAIRTSAGAYVAGHWINNPFLGAEAIYADFGGNGIGSELDFGRYFILVGKDKGQFKKFRETARGIGTDASVGLEIGRIDIHHTPCENIYVAPYLFGDRDKYWGSFSPTGEGISFGGAYSFGNSFGSKVTGSSFQFGFGVSPIPFLIGIGYNKGEINPMQ